MTTHCTHGPDWNQKSHRCRRTAPQLRLFFAVRRRAGRASAIASNWLAEEIAFESQQVREAASADPLKPYSNEELDVALAELATFARTRPAFVARQIDPLK